MLLLIACIDCSLISDPESCGLKWTNGASFMLYGLTNMDATKDIFYRDELIDQIAAMKTSLQKAIGDSESAQRGHIEQAKANRILKEYVSSLLMCTKKLKL